MNRAQRRRLERQSDRVLATVRRAVLAVDPSKDWILAREGDDPIRVVDNELARRVLRGLGLEDLAVAIDASRAEYGPAWVPVAIMVEGWATCCWVQTHHLVRGGDA